MTVRAPGSAPQQNDSHRTGCGCATCGPLRRNLYDELLEKQRAQTAAEEAAGDLRYSTKRFAPEMPPRRPFAAPIRRYKRAFATAEEREAARAALRRRGLLWVLK